MSEGNKERPPEPEEVETKELQRQASTPAVIPAVDINRVIEGHPLSEAFRSISAAFRSQLTHKVLEPWIANVTKEFEQCREALTEANRQLQSERVENATLKTKLSEYGRRVNLSLVVQTIGGLAVGSASVFYEMSTPLGHLVLAVGLILLVAGWWYGKAER